MPQLREGPERFELRVQHGVAYYNGRPTEAYDFVVSGMQFTIAWQEVAGQNEKPFRFVVSQRHDQDVGIDLIELHVLYRPELQRIEISATHAGSRTEATWNYEVGWIRTNERRAPPMKVAAE